MNFYNIKNNKQYNNISIYTVILAAGTGERMNACGTLVPKQYIKFNKKSMLEIIINNFENIDIIEKIFVVTNIKHHIFYKNINKSFLKTNVIDCGGNSRMQSMYNIVCYIIDKQIKIPDYIIIHDGDRPYITKYDITYMIKYFLQIQSLCLIYVARTTDALIGISKYKKNIIDRNSILSVQTPQIYNARILFDFYTKNNIIKNKLIYNDESTMLIDNGYNIDYIINDKVNYKITYDYDLFIYYCTLINSI